MSTTVTPQSIEAAALDARNDRDERDERRAYEAPRVLKRRSVSRVTLFSGGGATAGGLTAAG